MVAKRATREHHQNWPVQAFRHSIHHLGSFCIDQVESFGRKGRRRSGQELGERARESHFIVPSGCL